MGTLFGFAVGYVIGARAGNQGFDDLMRAFSDIRSSEEYQAFRATLREHARHTLRQLNERLARIGDDEAEDVLLARARAKARLRS